MPVPQRNCGKKNVFPLCTLIFALSLVILVAGCSSSSTPTITPPPPVTGTVSFIYTANAAGSPATVSALMSDATSGALSLVSGSPYGAGTSSFAIAAHPTGKFLYVANYFSADISGFQINPTTGALTAIATPPFGAELGVDALALDPTGAFLYAVSERSTNLWIFSVDSSSGALTNLSGSPTSISATDNGSAAVMVDPSGKFLYTLTEDSLSSKIYAFSRDLATGAVTALASSPFPVDVAAHALATDPAGKFVLAVSNGPSTSFGTLSVYSLDNASGALTLIGTPTHTDPDPVALVVEPTGKYVYTANESTSTVSAFSLSSAGSLSPISGSPFPSGGNGTINGPGGIVADSSGRFLYVCNASNDVSAFRINSSTGGLTAINGSPFANGGNGPHGIAIVKKP